MPERKREAWVPDAEARELDVMFILRDIRRRESLPGTVCQYIGAGSRRNGQSLSRCATAPFTQGSLRAAGPYDRGAIEGAKRRSGLLQKDSRGRLPVWRWILLLGGFLLLVLALGVLGSVETGRMEILPGVLLMVGFGGLGVMAMEGSGMLR